MSITVAGGGAFGTALAIALSGLGPIDLFVRTEDAAEAIRRTGESPRLPGRPLPPSVVPTADAAALAADIVCLAIPAQKLRGFLSDHADHLGGALVACAKGIDLTTLNGPTASIAAVLPQATAAVLSGPSFADDIARGLPTALVLACADDDAGRRLQEALSTPVLRLYRTTDVTGVELGGALKNVVAIACGASIGAGFGDSARAALMTRGFAEMTRLAATMGARPETLAGLSGLGDLALTCTSDLSRNYRFGLALGRGETFAGDATVEGVATARAALRLAEEKGLDLPVTAVVARLVAGEITTGEALRALLDRPLKEE
ncbi:NAD(P)H-dependent glycerol-3-phosphate dehydrogenase [Wenxinia marina]|uniref:Glycerol-3-phosphate dehydrogenase [NAD(P)+] n=1 Tax=Wenxinia marina DSM 24838 TaxID=1123501 RepID=A0A0D0QJ83_9RHOB|nr:NAD(P)H-dependent glycerol-3-phosphate dehydrogenase [Wenxinia marina]KIQ71098.1 Glycerol-3-phosphate dehydrogenase [Wenxinia marina DSM 24838]GGL54846.1 glycerol-3-phosphate dehydrogenase [NAD(P)+] [Wenxinia marina]